MRAFPKSSQGMRMSVVTDHLKESSTNLRNNFKNKEHYAATARQTGIAECICYDARTGSRSSVVLRKAINAIIAAVFLDTWNPKLTTVIILRYKLLTRTLHRKMLII